MFTNLKSGFANSLVLTFQAGIVYYAFKIGSRSGWMLAGAMLALISFAAWSANHRRHRAITDIPLSRISSAAQGYVALQGVAQAHEGMLIQNSTQGLPCVWRRYKVERIDGGNSEVVDSGVSDTTFLLRDESGTCVIDPDDAEVITTSKHVYMVGEYRHTEYYLLPNDTLYVLGEFITKADPLVVTNSNEAVKELLNEWKFNKAVLLSRFDKNRDREIDIHEWALAREEAKRVVAQNMNKTRTNSGLNIVREPTSDRLYLLANLVPEQLAPRYYYWGWFHLLAFFAGVIIFTFSLARH
ncbi:MAG: hypothetical protein WCD07_06380 [Burkholderiales bacterium]